VTDARPVRPTIRCALEDLGFGRLPPASQPLHALQHMLPRKAQERFASGACRGERIREIDDRVFLKAKVGRWRGAVWRDLPEQWLCAAGWREEGSPDDFYASLVERCRSWRKEYNSTHPHPLTTDTYSGPILPTEDDRKRLLLEAAEAQVLAFEIGIPALVKAAVRSPGSEQRAQIGGYAIGVYIERHDIDGIYVAIRIQGPVSAKEYTVILNEVPGTDLTSWHIDRLPHRGSRPGEVVWSTIMDPSVAASLAADD
jgi:hypothetical protein